MENLEIDSNKLGIFWILSKIVKMFDLFPWNLQVKKNSNGMNLTWSLQNWKPVNAQM